ncbi:MAG: hypothetical protein WCF84_19075 [Anaerolineae bacterium]
MAEPSTLDTKGPATIAYAVWIRGKGWLRDSGDSVFADLHIEMAQGAAQLWGKGARVVPFDDAMLNLEKVFLAREREVSWTSWFIW